MVKIIPYNPALKDLAKKLRKNMTPGEVLLWNEINKNQIFGFDFDRQRCIDKYIVDFYCKELMLAIEIDGRYHEFEEVLVKDETRQQTLESFRIRVLRFSEADVTYDMFNVIRTLETTIIAIIKNDPNVVLPKRFDKKLLDQ